MCTQYSLGRVDTSLHMSQGCISLDHLSKISAAPPPPCASEANDLKCCASVRHAGVFGSELHRLPLLLSILIIAFIAELLLLSCSLRQTICTEVLQGASEKEQKYNLERCANADQICSPSNFETNVPRASRLETLDLGHVPRRC